MEGAHTPAFRYLPDESEVNGIGSWTYSYDMSLYESAQGMDLGSATVSGTFVELGMVSVSVDGQSVDGYRLTNTYLFDYPGLDFGLGDPMGAFVREGYVDQVWVAGVGLYSEEHVANYSDGTSFTASKQLDSISGLTPIQ